MDQLMCDRHDSARAQTVLTNVIDGDLLALAFCGHCTQMNAVKMVAKGWWMTPLSQLKLTTKTEYDQNYAKWSEAA